MSSYPQNPNTYKPNLRPSNPYGRTPTIYDGSFAPKPDGTNHVYSSTHYSDGNWTANPYGPPPPSQPATQEPPPFFTGMSFTGNSASTAVSGPDRDLFIPPYQEKKANPFGWITPTTMPPINYGFVSEQTNFIGANDVHNYDAQIYDLSLIQDNSINSTRHGSTIPTDWAMSSSESQLQAYGDQLAGLSPQLINELSLSPPSLVPPKDVVDQSINNDVYNKGRTELTPSSQERKTEGGNSNGNVQKDGGFSLKADRTRTPEEQKRHEKGLRNNAKYKEYKDKGDFAGLARIMDGTEDDYERENQATDATLANMGHAALVAAEIGTAVASGLLAPEILAGGAILGSGLYVAYKTSGGQDDFTTFLSKGYSSIVGESNNSFANSNMGVTTTSNAMAYY